jgi:hypothetical protein
MFTVPIHKYTTYKDIFNFNLFNITNSTLLHSLKNFLHTTFLAPTVSGGILEYFIMFTQYPIDKYK